MHPAQRLRPTALKRAGAEGEAGQVESAEAVKGAVSEAAVGEIEKKISGAGGLS